MKPPKFQPKRMLKLATLLRKDASTRKGVQFDFGDWGTVRNPDAPLSCGTTACAMGVAALSGAFKRAGLDYALRRSLFDGFVEKTVIFRWKGRRTDAIRAASHLFGITLVEACELFLPRCSAHVPNYGQGAKAERAVAANIERFVEYRLSQR